MLYCRLHRTEGAWWAVPVWSLLGAVVPLRAFSVVDATEGNIGEPFGLLLCVLAVMAKEERFEYL